MKQIKDLPNYPNTLNSLAQSLNLSPTSFKGLAATTTNPTVVSGVTQWWLASGAGTYTNFGGIVITENFAVLSYNGTAWSKWEATITAPNVVQTTGISTANVMSQNTVTLSIQNERTLTSNWLTSYNVNSGVADADKKIGLVIKAIKDIWFEFPGGTIPQWFNDRTPILRSISNNNHDTDVIYPFRLYFMLPSDVAFNDAYKADAQMSFLWESSGIKLLSISATIESVTVIVNAIVDGSELYASFVPTSGIVFPSYDGIQLKIAIRKKLKRNYDPVFATSIASLQTQLDIFPQIVNNPFRRKTIGQTLRICCFGSSWFQNTWWYLNKIIQSAGIDAELTCFYTGGAQFSEWNSRWLLNSNVDCWKSTNGSDWVQTTAPFATTLLEGWDIIAFQQGAYQSIDWNGYWENEWSDLISRVKRSSGIDTVIAFNSTWTPAIGSVTPSTIDGQKAWQTANYTNVKKFLALSGVQYASPCGAAMWAMRRNVSLNLANDLATDGLHADNGLPMYGLAGVFYETYIAPLYGVRFDEVNWLPDVNTQKCVVTAGWQSINETQRDIVREIVRLALSNRFGFNEL